jgi:hypothetical protein
MDLDPDVVPVNLFVSADSVSDGGLFLVVLSVYLNLTLVAWPKMFS